MQPTITSCNRMAISSFTAHNNIQTTVFAVWLMMITTTGSETLTSSSLWFRIPLTRSCRFLSSTRSMFIFTRLSAMVIFAFKTLFSLCWCVNICTNAYYNLNFFGQKNWAEINGRWMGVMWPATKKLFLTSFWSCDQHLFGHLHGDTGNDSAWFNALFILFIYQQYLDKYTMW